MPNRLLYRCLTFSLAALLLLLHSGLGTVWGRAKQPVKTLASAKAPAKHSSRKEARTGAQKEETVVKATLDEAVVAPALSFDFSQVTYLLFTNQLRLLTLERPLLRQAFEVPTFYTSYLRQVFGHLIAPNAP